MTRLCDLRPGDVSRSEERKGWLGAQPGLDPQTEPLSESWRDETWTDELFRRHESSETERRAA